MADHHDPPAPNDGDGKPTRPDPDRAGPKEGAPPSQAGSIPARAAKGGASPSRKETDRGPGIDPKVFDALLDGLLDLAPEDRTEFLDREAPRGTPEREDIEALLRAADAGASALDRAGQAAERLLSEDDPGAPVAEAIPRSIGGYDILRHLGRGGMGTVYLARRPDDGLDRDVALKVVSRAGDDPVRARFRAEQRILSRLEHPNVARLYEAGIDERGVPFFVMEYVDGVPIDEFADREGLSIEERVRLVRQLTDALSYAHRNLIVHRDVKPSNILVTADGVVKLLDFGVAKLMAPDPGQETKPLTRPGAPLLTPEYASPEQIRGEPVTTATDVYAAGVLLYELLTGARPYEFTSRSPVHIEAVVSGTEPRRPSAAVTSAGAMAAEARRSVPSRLSRALAGDLDWILLKALRKEPEARYGSIQALSDDLDRYLRREPVQARRPTPWYRTRRFVTRHRGPVAAAALVVLSLAAGLAGTRWQANRATREAEQSRRVKEMLVGLFEAADPDLAQGRDLSALELLDQGQRTMLAGLQDEPTVRAELLNILGSVYTALGEYDRAEPLLDSALSVAEILDEEELLVSSLAASANLRYGQGRYDEGEAVALRRLEILEAAGGEPSTALAAAMTDVATFYSSTARFEEAEGLILDALEIDRSLDAHEKEGQDWNSLSILRARKGDYDGAIAAGRSSVRAHRRHATGDQTSLATGLASLAWALDLKGEFAEADTVYHEALAMRRRILGDEHPHVAILLNNLGSMRQKEGRLGEARTLHEEALELRRRIFGNDHDQVAGSLNNLAIVDYYEQDYAGAADAFREALRIFRLNLPADHPNVLTGTNNLAAVLRAQGRLDEAEVLFRSTLDDRLRVLGPDHHDTGGAHNNLGGVLRLQGRAAEAADAHRRAIAVFEAALDPDHPDLADARLSLARALIDLQQPADALPFLDQACAVYGDRYAPDHPSAAGCQAAIGIALVGAGATEDGRQVLETALPVLEEQRAGQEWTVRAREVLDGITSRR